MNDTPCSRCGLRPKNNRRINQSSPYATFFNGIPLDQNPRATPTTRDELASFIHDVENELLDCDADIARVEDMLRLLKQERQAGQSFLTRHKSLLSHVHTLPPEVMLEIFRNCLDGNPESLLFGRPHYRLSRRGNPIPWILSAVCRRWRNILRESPSYWSSFDVGAKSHFLEDALQLSRQAPLHFNIGLAFNGDFCKRALLKHTSRWETVFISGPLDAFVSLGRLETLPQLRKLCVLLERTWDEELGVSDPEEIMDYTTALAPFVSCPQLDELHLSLPDEIWINDSILETASLSIPWANLSKLAVSFGADSTQVILSLLQVCTNLRELDVCRFGDSYGLNPVQSDTLLNSTIASLTLVYPLDLFQHTEYTALTHLSIADTDPKDILPFLSRKRRNISHFSLELRLGRHEEPEGSWETLLPLLPDVIHFTVHLSRYSKKIDHSWAIFSKALGVELPNLRRLTIDFRVHLLVVCYDFDLLPLIVSRWSARKLQVLEINSLRQTNWSTFERSTLPLTLQTVPPPELSTAVSRGIMESIMIKTLRLLQEEGLEVIINDIPLSERSADLYM